MKRIVIHISGKVQGVFFREGVCKVAGALGIVGTVANMPDGRVEIVAEGNVAPLTKLLDWCHNGPTHARVEQVEKVWEDIDRKAFHSFDIRS